MKSTKSNLEKFLGRPVTEADARSMAGRIALVVERSEAGAEFVRDCPWPVPAMAEQMRAWSDNKQTRFAALQFGWFGEGDDVLTLLGDIKTRGGDGMLYILDVTDETRRLLDAVFCGKSTLMQAGRA